jgi:hypothetical protein
MNTLDTLLPLISAKLGRDLGPSADWINAAFLVYRNADKSGAWYLIYTEEDGESLSLGFRADADDAVFEVETTIPFAEIPAWLESGLPAFVEKCRSIDDEDQHRYGNTEPAPLAPADWQAHDIAQRNQSITTALNALYFYAEEGNSEDKAELARIDSAAAFLTSLRW